MHYVFFTVYLFRNQAKLMDAAFLCMFFKLSFSPSPALEGGFIVSLTECIQPPWFSTCCQKDKKTLTPEIGSKGLNALVIFNTGSERTTILGATKREKACRLNGFQSLV